MSEKQQHLMTCDCVGEDSILRVTQWDDEDEFYAELFVVPRSTTWRWRLKYAWRALRGDPVPDPVVMFERPSGEALRDWLTARLG